MGEDPAPPTGVFKGHSVDRKHFHLLRMALFVRFSIRGLGVGAGCRGDRWGGGVWGGGGDGGVIN